MSDEVVVAVIAAAAPTVAAVSTLVVSIRNGKQLRGNGQGTHTEMMEKTITKLDTLHVAFDDHVREDREVAQEVRDLHASTMGKLDDVIETQNALVRRALK